MSKKRRGPPGDAERRPYGAFGTELPHNASAEASVLGGVILNNDALALIDTTDVEDFYDNRHKVVFQAIRNLEAAGRPIDTVTIENEIAKVGKLEAIGGVAFLGELTLHVPTVDNVVWYAEIIRKHRITRDVLVMTGQVISEATSDGREGDELVHDLTVGLLSVTTGAQRKIYTMAELISAEADRVVSDVEAKLAGKNVLAGVPTGIRLLDEKIGGNPRGVPVVYMARPSCGKTTIAMHLAWASRHIAGIDSLLATYEDGPQSFAQRGLAQESKIATELIRSRKISPEQLDEMRAAVLAGASRTEAILPAAGMTVEELVRHVRRENLIRRSRGKAPFGQLLVDYIQNMPQPEHANTRDEGIGHICAVLAAFAQQEDIPVAIFSQLNREVERRDDKRPRLSDARESGAIENAGKVIIGIYRPWLYEPNKRDKDGKLVHTENDLHLLCLKNNQGEAMFDIKLFMDVKSHRVYDSEIEYGAERLRKSDGRPAQQTLGDDDFHRRLDEAGDWHIR